MSKRHYPVGSPEWEDQHTRSSKIRFRKIQRSIKKGDVLVGLYAMTGREIGSWLVTEIVGSQKKYVRVLCLEIEKRYRPKTVEKKSWLKRFYEWMVDDGSFRWNSEYDGETWDIGEEKIVDLESLCWDFGIRIARPSNEK